MARFLKSNLNAKEATRYYQLLLNILCVT